jgi:hypothetical protein
VTGKWPGGEGLNKLARTRAVVAMVDQNLPLGTTRIVSENSPKILLDKILPIYYI